MMIIHNIYIQNLFPKSENVTRTKNCETGTVVTPELHIFFPGEIFFQGFPWVFKKGLFSK